MPACRLVRFVTEWAKLLIVARSKAATVVPKIVVAALVFAGAAVNSIRPITVVTPWGDMRGVPLLLVLAALLYVPATCGAAWVLSAGVAIRLQAQVIIDQSGDLQYRRVACIRVVNQEPAHEVVNPRVHVEQDEIIGGRWGPEVRAQTGWQPTQLGFKFEVQRFQSQTRDFRTDALFHIAVQPPASASFHWAAIDQSVQATQYYEGDYGVHVEVTVSNNGTKPVSGWFKLSFHPGQPLTLEPWVNPSERASRWQFPKTLL